jgi:arylsulfatase A
VADGPGIGEKVAHVDIGGAAGELIEHVAEVRPGVEAVPHGAAAHAQARLTCLYAGAPVCSPSRAALFSGRNPNRLGIRDWIDLDSGVHLPRSTVTVAQRLKAAGYTTCLSGKWHLNSRFNGREPTPGDFGFDHWFATQNNAKHQDPTNFVRDGQRAGPLHGHATTLVVDEAIRFIDRAEGRPFAVFVTFHAPHEQIQTPEAYTSMYADVPDPTERDYYGSVSLVDHEVGRLMAALDSRGLRDRTLVLFTSDNGPEGLRRYQNAIHSHGSAGPLRGKKLSLYEGGLRVPGVVRWPGWVKAGGECSEPMVFYDVLPTLCAVAGAAPAPGVALDGINILPLLDGQAVERRVPLHWQYDRAQDGPWRIALRRGRWKILADADRGRFALFDLEGDIAETRDLAAERPEVVERLRAELERGVCPGERLIRGEIRGRNRAARRARRVHSPGVRISVTQSPCAGAGHGDACGRGHRRRLPDARAGRKCYHPGRPPRAAVLRRSGPADLA